MRSEWLPDISVLPFINCHWRITLLPLSPHAFCHDVPLGLQAGLAYTSAGTVFALFPFEKRLAMKKTTSSKTPKPPRPMDREAVEHAARADRDAHPLPPADLARMKRTPQVKVVRRALDLTQEEFAERYHIPLGTLRDWEQGRAEPDQPTKAYLTLIARDPEHVNHTLNSKH